MKILVIRLSSIGDIVLTSPVVRILKKQLNAEVHFLTKKAIFLLGYLTILTLMLFIIMKKVRTNLKP